MNILKQNKQPILSEIEGHEKQFYEEPAELSTKQYLNQVHKQVKQIDGKIGQLSKQLEQQAKQDKRQQRKEQLNLFRKPIIKTKEQIQQEKKDKEEKRLNQFIQEMVDKYSPYLLKPEKVEKTQEQLIYQEEYQQYLADKQQKIAIGKGLKAKEMKPFLFSNNCINQQSTLQEDIVQTEQNKEQHQKLIQIQQKQVQNERKKRQQMIYFKILDEKIKADTSTFSKKYKSIILRIFTKIDQEHCGYISKQELIDYFEEFQIFIDLFDLDWLKFRNFVLKVKALRKGLLNKQELILILEDTKLKLPIDEVIAKIKQKPKSDYKMPKEDDENNDDTEQQQIQQDNDKILENNNINQKDPNVDYQQLEEITQINKIYQDKYYPLYHDNIQDKKLLLDINQNKEQKEKKKLDPNFISFANQISDLQIQYGQGQLAYQKDESNLIEEQLTKMYIKR